MLANVTLFRLGNGFLAFCSLYICSVSISLFRSFVSLCMELPVVLLRQKYENCLPVLYGVSLIPQQRQFLAELLAPSILVSASVLFVY